MVFVLSNEERLEKCIKTLEEIKSCHDINIIMGDKVILDRAYYMAKECLDEVMNEIQDDVALKAICFILHFMQT